MVSRGLKIVTLLFVFWAYEKELYEGYPLSIDITSTFLLSKSIIAFFIQYDICSGCQKCQLLDVIVSS
jgi:hypothetical protein